MNVTTFIRLLGISSNRYYRLAHHLRLGGVSAPLDRRHERQVEAPATERADAWLNWCYNALAEPFAELRCADFDEQAEIKFPELGRATDDGVRVINSLSTAKETRARKQ